MSTSSVLKTIGFGFAIALVALGCNQDVEESDGEATGTNEAELPVCQLGGKGGTKCSFGVAHTIVNKCVPCKNVKGETYYMRRIADQCVPRLIDIPIMGGPLPPTDLGPWSYRNERCSGNAGPQ